jgi:copper(I)-binding protein
MAAGGVVVIARRIVEGLLSLVSALLLAGAAHAGPLQAHDGYVREMPPGQSTTAAFVTLVNSGAAPVALVAASSAAADRVEIHTHRHGDGTTRMERVARVEVPANGQLQLQPGGYHLMLIDLSRPLRAGDRVAITLLDEKGGAHPVELPVVDMRQGAPAPAAGHEHHH